MARLFPIRPKRRAKPGENQVYKGSPQPDNHQSASDVAYLPACHAFRSPVFRFNNTPNSKMSRSTLPGWVVLTPAGSHDGRS